MIIECDKITLTLRTHNHMLVVLFLPNDIRETNESYNVFNVQIGKLARISLDNLKNVG